MKLPKSFTLNGRRWKVKLEALDGDMGRCNHRERSIIIDPDQAADEMEDTFLHELLHACLGMELREFIGAKREELIVEVLTGRLLSVLKQTKWKP